MSTKLNAAFKKWFGDSKVVDSRGQPLVVWHASPEKFNVFKTDREGAHFGTYEQAVGLRKTGKRKPRPFFLSIKNPLRMIDLGVWSDFNGLHAQLVRDDVITMKEADEIWQEWQQGDERGWKALKAMLRAKGYDGIVYENEQEGTGDSYIAFFSAQIKLANNDGTWDADDSDVRSNPSPSTFWGRAGAGVLFHCTADNTYMLLLRSDEVEQPGTWGVPGGSCSGEGFYKDSQGRAVATDEAWECAQRETEEEISMFPAEYELGPVIVFKKGSFSYTTFVVNISAAEKEKINNGHELNWENDRLGWWSAEDLLHPADELHFGVEYVVKELKKARVL